MVNVVPIWAPVVVLITATRTMVPVTSVAPVVITARVLSALRYVGEPV